MNMAPMKIPFISFLLRNLIKISKNTVIAKRIITYIIGLLRLLGSLKALYSAGNRGTIKSAIICIDKKIIAIAIGADFSFICSLIA